VIDRASAAVVEAIAKARLVTHLGLGQAEVEKVASNRRILGPDGKVQHVRYTACADPKVRDMPVGTIDPMLKMISFWDGGAPVAALTYYATHPQSYYRTGLACADFPGIARDLRQHDTQVAHIHFDGAGGNIGAGKWNDGSPANESQRKLLGELAAVEAKATDRSWGPKLEGLRRRKLALQAERQRIAADHQDDLIAELHEEGEQVHTELVAAVEAMYPVRDRWAALAGAYREFKAARGGPQATGRLDLPPFPVEIGPLPEPVPAALAEDRDPTIREGVTA
jgi:hypothetical protein